MDAADLLNLAGLVLLGAGFLWKDRRAHPMRMVGWLFEGVFWGLRSFHYLWIDDQFNALGAAAALPIFWYLGFHEAKSYQWDDDYPPLRFVAGAMFIAGLGYFIIGSFPPVSEIMIRVTADQSVWLANLGGYSFAIGDVSPERALLVGVPIMIVIECTAVQAYLVAGSFLFGCRGDAKRRALVLAVIIAVVWFVNLVRNAAVMILVHNNGEDYFDFAHNIIGKGLSFAALILLILMAFIQVPQLYEDINGLFELPWRKGPKHDYLRFVGRLYSEKEGPGKD